MGKFRNLIFLGLLAALFFEVLIVFPNHLEKQEQAEVKKAAQEEEEKSKGSSVADQKMTGVHLVESQKGARDWELFAEEAEGNQGQGNWNLRKARIQFYKQTEIEFTVTGDEGAIDAKTKDLRVRGNVVTTSSNGYTFKTQDIFYDAGSRKISTQSKVQMIGPKDRDGAGMKVEGESMLVDVEASKMTIPAEVRGSKELNGGRRMELLSESAEFSGRNREAKFIGDVKMRYDRVTLEGPTASFLQSGNGDFLSNIRFSGGVKVSDEDKFATSENLNLDLVMNRFVFTGKPKVYQDDDELSGEQIIFLDGGKKVKVEGVRARLENQKQ